MSGKTLGIIAFAVLAAVLIATAFGALGSEPAVGVTGGL